MLAVTCTPTILLTGTGKVEQPRRRIRDLADHDRPLPELDAPAVAALRQADALLFVCDATQPILAPEVESLSQAADRIEAIVVVVNKSDGHDHDVVVAETRRRLSERPNLARLPVFPVSAVLAELAARTPSPPAAARLTALSGIREPVRHPAARRRRQHRPAADREPRPARRQRRQRAARPHRQITGEPEPTAALAALLADRSGLINTIERRLELVRTESIRRFCADAETLGQRYRGEAERGPATQLPALAPCLIADLTAAGATVLDGAWQRTLEMLRDGLRQIGGEAEAQLLLPAPTGLRLGLRAPAQQPRPTVDIAQTAARTVDLLPTVTGILTGSALVVSVLTGPGAIAASIALAACAGWWRIRGESEQQRRTQLIAWTDVAIGDAQAGFDTELRHRFENVQAYLSGELPGLLDARLARLTRQRAESIERARAEAARASLAMVLDELIEDHRSTA